MSNISSLAVALNVGLNTVAPPLGAPLGSLTSVLNYETTDTAGYRRINGYEKYDGFPNGAVNAYYRIDVTAVNPTDQALIVVGSIITRSNSYGGQTVIGTVVGGPFSGTLYDIVPVNSSNDFVLSEEFLLLNDGGLVVLNSGGFLRINGPEETLGSTFYVTTPSGVTFEVQVGEIQEGTELVDVGTYFTNVRSYSSILREMVDDAPAEIAGLYWFDDRLYAAVNALEVTIVIPVAGTQPTEGERARWNGTIYRITKLVLKETSGGNNTYLAYLLPVETTATVTDDLVQISASGTVGATWISGMSAFGYNTSDSPYAYLGYFNTPDFSSSRGFVYLTPATTFKYDAGNHPDTLGFPITFDEGNNPSDAYFIVGDAGATVLKVRVTQQTKASGNFTTGTAEGSAQVVIINRIAGGRDYIKDNDELHSTYPTTGSSRVATVNGTPTITSLAGTASLDLYKTRYQWETANFYGQVSTTSAYGCTGASKAFWANKNGYGELSTGSPQDTPKYLAFHAGRLALGFAKGSVLLSVEGEPYNYQGVDGAIEIATGDTITGLLELPGDTLAVFGRRAIRKITGSSASDVRLGTIAGHGGCFDYTAVLIGSDAVFTGINGVTTLQQTAAYGDFAGERLTDTISNWLRPKLITGNYGFQQGGVVMAYPVRSKNQYRLVLITGETVCVTITSEGPKITILNHSSEGKTRYPYAWSSEIDMDGKERIHVRWNVEDTAKQVYELETGWGFNGKTFEHYFELAPIFADDGQYYMTIDKIRLYGLGHGLATLNIKIKGIEEDFDQPYHDAIQDISLPYRPSSVYNNMYPVTASIDHANYGRGLMIKIQGTIEAGGNLTEPAHICQMAVLRMKTQGASD